VVKGRCDILLGLATKNVHINFQQFLNISFVGHTHCPIIIPDEITSKMEANWSSAFKLKVIFVLELVNIVRKVLYSPASRSVWYCCLREST